MIKHIIYLLLGCVLVGCETPFFSSPKKFETPFEQKDGLKNSTYEEIIDYYKELSKEFTSISFKTIGQTDNGMPLHLVIYSADGEFNLNKYREERTIIFINNAIHGNETDGVNATTLLFRNLAQNEIKLSGNVIVVTIPVYNIGGMQEDRKESATYYDLDNDFIKADVENTLSLSKVLQEIQPDILIDNQVSRKEEYRYTVSYSPAEKEKVGTFLGGYIDDVLVPRLSDSLTQMNYISLTKDSIQQPFRRLLPAPELSKARHAVGYASLWNCIGIQLNTHIFKSYNERVVANYETMKTIVEIADADNAYIKQLKIKQAQENAALVAPKYYIVPQAWQKVIDRLKVHNVQMKEVVKDTLMKVDYYQIDDFKTVTTPFEGHYLHYDTQASIHNDSVRVYKGDYIVPTAQLAKRYLIEVLTPTEVDSFFNWNFFDSVLGKDVKYPILMTNDKLTIN